MTALRPIAQKWFRIEVRGADNIPAEGGALVVSNHSGTRPGRRPDDDGDHPRRTPAATCARWAPTWSSGCRSSAASPARAAPPSPATRTPSGCWRRRAGRRLAGGLQGHRQAVRRALQAPAVRPGRLRLGRDAHRRTHHPAVGGRAPRRSTRWSATSPRWPGCSASPYIPITPFFPLLGPLGLVPLPSKWLLEFGEPIRTDEYDAGAADDPMLVFNVTDQVRETIQQTLYSLLMKRQSVFR